MARGPWQGTFQPNVRPVVVTAPDALVMINNSTQVIGCPTCNRTFDINKYITSIQVDLSVDSVPGSASLALSVPRHTIDDFYFDNSPVIIPMMEINIYAKGFYLVEGLPQYYPIFWGLITEVNDSYSGGEHTVSIHCADILKWWELCRMNVNPAYTSPVPAKFGITLNGNVFSGMNPLDVIWTLAQQAFGDIVIGGGSLVTLTQDSKTVFKPVLSDVMAYWSQRFQNVTKNLMLYGSTGVAVRGDKLMEEFKNAKPGQYPKDLASAAVRKATGAPVSEGGSPNLIFNAEDSNVVAFRTNNSNISVNFWQNEFQTKLEIANVAKDAIGYEFFMDVTGDIVFKPPFYNLDILSNKPVSWIQDIDVIDWDLAESEAEVVTQLTLGGNYSGNTDWGWPAEMTPFSNVTDYHLLRQYGWRPAQLNSEFMGQDLISLFYYGLDALDRMNAKRHRGTVTIPFRPEMRLGFPVYLASKDQIWYVQGISHNIAFGGRATTSLTLIAKREKFKAPQGIGTIALTDFNAAIGGTANPGGSAFAYTGRQLSQGGTFTVQVGEAAQNPPLPSALTGGNVDHNPYTPLILRDPQTGKILGYPNVVMVYLQPYAPTLADYADSAGNHPFSGLGSNGRGKPNANLIATKQKNMQQQASKVVYDLTQNPVQDKHLTNRSWYGLTSAGVFVYAHDLGQASASSSSNTNVQGVIGDIVIVPAGKLIKKTLNSTDTTAPVSNSQTMIRPVSDSRGFEVIGHYRYGRGVSLTDGQLVSNTQQGNYQAANVSIQVALSGSLSAALTAQSQGLTAVVSAYPNPVAAIASLQPDDLRTSGFTTPNNPTPQYGNTQTNFVTQPVLGNPQQTGVFASVEASQLSQGLTLAEMDVLDNMGAMDGTSATQPQCMCLLGRSDLAFINTGYQVKNLNQTAPDPATLPNPNAFADGAPTVISSSTIPDGLSATDQQAYAQSQMNGGSPVSSSIATASPTQVENIIDEFLFKLYSTLDAPHQAYEQELRGDTEVLPQPGANGSLSVGPAVSGNQDFAPPFSAASRYAAGDPTAIAQQAQSNAHNLAQAWSSFGTTLTTTAQIGSLSQTIANNQSDLAQLQRQLANIPATAPPSESQQIQIQIAALTQTISNEQTQLGQLRAQQAAGPVVPQLATPPTGRAV